MLEQLEKNQEDESVEPSAVSSLAKPKTGGRGTKKTAPSKQAAVSTPPTAKSSAAAKSPATPKSQVTEKSPATGRAAAQPKRVVTKSGKSRKHSSASAIDYLKLSSPLPLILSICGLT